jgi:hypothetical protein
MSLPAGQFLDTTVRPLCFPSIGRVYTPEDAKKIGPAEFKKYEYLLYICAQVSRLVYCDSGILQKVIESSLGRSNDIVNKVITAYDAQFSKEKRAAITSQEGVSVKGPTGTYTIPMESYSLGPKPTGATQYGTYISTPEDMTCLILDTSKLAANPNSILTPNDLFIAFKGSSTVSNFKHDLMSQFTAGDLATELKQVGIDVAPLGNVTVSFVKPLLNAFSAMMDELSKHIERTQCTRLFLTGHSLGGAYASLFTWILALAKQSGNFPALEGIQGFHLLSYGSPTILSDTARNNFNTLLDEGLITLDRVVSQKVPARSSATQVLVGGMGGPNDVIPNIPAGFSHPGYRPLATDVKPESKGRPYSMDFIRSTYGIEKAGRYRDERTWPFEDAMSLGDRAQKSQLNSTVSQLTGVQSVPEEPSAAAVMSELNKKAGGGRKQTGGLFGVGAQKSVYDKLTAQRIPNFISVQGSAYAFTFAHAEYMGMFFFGGFRLPGMKNPATGTYMARFPLTTGGVDIVYEPFSPLGSVKAVQEGGRRAKTRKSQKRRRRNQTRRR